ncbi:MAG: 23S rRNA (adenine(2503)-C(2))-methyltransferase RlmN [Syntrophaceae bacterium]|nr:23S rRNA (adenine(2503)-C(2))-methyltransferase RlmN [Syntrophaceae bacterium]
MSARDGRIALKDLSLQDLEAFIVSLGEKPFRAIQVARWLYGKGVRGFEEMSNLSRSFRQKLEEAAWISVLEPAEVQSSRDGTRKFRFILADGEAIESVLLPEKDHLTLCLSSQGGCALGCRFCLTGKRGWVRNLKASEIIDQVIGVRSTLSPGEKLTNLVLMGMGEPLLNYPNVLQALEVLRSPLGLQFSNRRITLSTAGIIPEMVELLSRRNFVKLAISLNAATDEQRTELMPINRKYPLKDLLSACRKVPLPNRERITFEYVLIRGVNDSPEDARRLARLLKGIKAKVNLIAFNEHPESPFRRPPDEAIRNFREILMAKGFTAMLRQSKGSDILAACGQLGGKAFEDSRTQKEKEIIKP